MVDQHPLFESIDQILDTIRPYLQNDGGDIELVNITEDMTVQVKLKGACESCPMSFMTMKAGVEASIKKSHPEVQKVEAINV